MAFRDGKRSRDEREKARREERRKALSARLGGRPDQPGRSEAEREETKRRRETAKPAAEGTPSADAGTETKKLGAEKPTAETPKAEEPKKSSQPARGRREPARRERKPKRRFWQRGSKPKPAAKPPRRRPEPEKPTAEESKTRRLRPEKPKAEDPKTRRLRPEKPKGEEPSAKEPKSEEPQRPEKPKAPEKPRSRTRARGDDRRRPSSSDRRKPSKSGGRSRQDRVKALRARGGSAAKSGGKALREGAAATRRRAKAAQPKVAEAGRKSWALAAPILALPLLALAFAERWIRTGLRAGGRALAVATAFLDRHVTPARAVLVVAVVAAGCLIVSQFQDYSGVEVGQPGYVEVQRTVSAEQVNQQTPRDAHGPWLLILAGLAIAAAVAATATRRRALGFVVSAVGVAGLLISLLGDRPEGLDESQTAVAYSGTHAVLLDGFYAQVAACGVLIAAGLLVALYAGAPARSRAKSPRRAQPRKPRTRSRGGVGEGGTIAEGGA